MSNRDVIDKRDLIGRAKRKIQTTIAHWFADKETRQLNKVLRLGKYEPGEFITKKHRIYFPDAHSFEFIYREMFHKEVYKFESKTKSPFIIDCGANIGVSVLYFKQLYPASKILAFEPDKNIFAYLQKNIHSDSNDVELVNRGVWSEEGSISFKSEGADAGRISLENDATVFREETIIKTVKLSSYIDKRVDFIKLDIEGAEMKVIEDIEKKLHLIDNIFIEYHSFANTDQELPKILKILSDNNFRYYIDSPYQIKKHPFIDKNNMLSFDLLLNIYATKE